MRPRKRFFMPAIRKKKPARNGKVTSPEVAAAKVKAAKALELRMEGKTFAAIAEEAGYNSPQAAYDAVKRSLDAITRQPATELLTLDLERLDAMWGIHFLNAQAGDVNALSACMRIMERRAKLLGLDAPAKQEVSGPAGGPIELAKGRSLSDFYADDVPAKPGA